MSCKDYTKVIAFGRNAIRYGIHYRRKYQRDFEKHGKLTCFYSLEEPTHVLSFIGGLIAAGIVQNASYEALKFCLKGLASSLRRMRLKGKTSDAGTAIASPQDLDVVYRLLGENGDYANHFRDEIQDYLNGMPGVHPDVRRVIQQEERMHREAAAFRRRLEKASTTPRHYVYVTPSGQKYHSKKCPLLRGVRQRISIDDAKRRYSPCQICKPG
jgi:hypothetical protein